MDIKVTQIFRDRNWQTPPTDLVPAGWAVATDGIIGSDESGWPNVFLTEVEAQAKATAIKTNRLEEIHAQLEEIRATWTEEQALDFSFHDPEFDALCHEEFMILSGGKDTIEISMEWVMANADEVVTL